MTRYVPVVAVVPEDVALRIQHLTAERRAQANDPEATATLAAYMDRNGWTLDMLVAGSLIRAALEDRDG